MNDPRAKARAERDIWTGMLEQRKRELIKAGVPEDEADEQASREIRRQIRES